MEAKKILFISQEVAPYLPDTSLSLLCRDIPQSIHGKEFEVRTFTPKYGIINERRNQLHEVIRLSGMNLIIDDTDHPLIIKVATLLPSRMQVYFIDNDDYFRALPDKGLETDLMPEDNDERVIFFTSGVAETVKKLRWSPAVIQCNGWISALAPLFFRTKYSDDPVFSNSRIVFALQPESFDGTLDPRFVEKLKMADILPEDIKSIETEPVDYAALSRLAIDFSDAVVQLAPGVDEALVEYAKSSGKPFMEYHEEDDCKQAAQRLVSFYRTLLD